MAQQVTIGCKLATGLIIGIGGKQVTLNGANSSRIIGGYGLTRVDNRNARGVRPAVSVLYLPLAAPDADAYLF